MFDWIGRKTTGYGRKQVKAGTPSTQYLKKLQKVPGTPPKWSLIGGKMAQNFVKVFMEMAVLTLIHGASGITATAAHPNQFCIIKSGYWEHFGIK